MKNLVLDEKTARNLYPTASNEFKALLHDSFGEKFFQQKITDRIKTFEDACAEAGEDPEDEKFNGPDKVVNAFQKIMVIVKALNPKDWKPDYANSNQRKWYPYFKYVPGTGFRFVVSDFLVVSSDLAGGSRTAFASEELSTYAAKQFETEFNQLLNP